MRQPAYAVKGPSPFVPVTDDDLDAPDGAVLFLETHQGVYERSGDEWACLDTEVSFVRPGTYVRVSAHGLLDDLLDQHRSTVALGSPENPVPPQRVSLSIFGEPNATVGRPDTPTEQRGQHT